MIILILPWEKLLNFGHEKLRKVMEKVLESHGILKVSKSTNPEVGISWSYTLGDGHIIKDDSNFNPVAKPDAIEQDFHAILFIMLYTLFLTSSLWTREQPD